ncbi:mechanosensitive ion channel protein [Saccharospirillum sp. MSK14-1]|uniref:mechanosensitive ion channel family protein n=1 Tax=Saccharospirillum sp. MSK14-1 TaxID=1897632 RepID=UPI000D3722D3|nr:mechanosensitive ion channel family protein [Saccharospirillum sp. MSK14-1]PTY37333.1 mechanosensitive ion channel protein [Saccharospirillum sp. MSK14-1]
MIDWMVNFWNSHAPLMLRVGYQIILVLLVFIVAGILSRTLKSQVTKNSKRFARLDPMLVPIFAGMVGYSVYVIAVVIVLDIFGVNTNSIVALLGAAGLAVGLALKDTLSNIAAGIMMLMLRPFRTGDYISFNSTSGTVEEITLFNTILITPDGQYVSAPNSNVWGATIQNSTRNGTRRMDVVVGVAYDDDLNAGFAALRKIVDAEPRFLPDPPPQIMVQSLGDSSVNLQIRAWATVDDYWPLWWDMQRVVKDEIEAAGLTIPFPQRDVHHYNTAPDQHKPG